MLIPNVSEVEKSLAEFAEIMEADEVLLFEKSTFLIIAHAQRTDHRDIHRFEKISNIIKQFKLSCIKLAAQFTVSVLHFENYTCSTTQSKTWFLTIYFFFYNLQYMEVRNSKFSAFLDAFTNHTYLCVVMPQSTFSTRLLKINIKAAKKHFEGLEKAVEHESGPSSGKR